MKRYPRFPKSDLQERTYPTFDEKRGSQREFDTSACLSYVNFSRLMLGIIDSRDDIFTLLSIANRNSAFLETYFIANSTQHLHFLYTYHLDFTFKKIERMWEAPLAITKNFSPNTALTIVFTLNPNELNCSLETNELFLNFHYEYAKFLTAFSKTNLSTAHNIIAGKSAMSPLECARIFDLPETELPFALFDITY